MKKIHAGWSTAVGESSNLCKQPPIAEKLATKYGFFDMGGERAVWDTTDLTTVNYEALLQQITLFRERPISISKATVAT